jgi:hypothetical protein
MLFDNIQQTDIITEMYGLVVSNPTTKDCATLFGTKQSGSGKNHRYAALPDTNIFVLATS